MPDELAAQAYERLREYAADLVEPMICWDGIFGRHKKGAIPVTYRTLSAAGTLRALYRIDRCAPSLRPFDLLSAYRPDIASD